MIQATSTSVSTPRITALASRPSTPPESRKRAANRSDGGPARKWNLSACPSARGTPSWPHGSAPQLACPYDPRGTSGYGNPHPRHGARSASWLNPIWDSYIGQGGGPPRDRRRKSASGRGWSCQAGARPVRILNAGPDAVQVIASGRGVVGVRAARIAVAGRIRAERSRAAGRIPRGQVGEHRLGGRVLEDGSLHAGEEVRGPRQHRVRLAVAVGVDHDARLVLRLVDVRPDRFASRAQVDAAGQLALAALVAVDRKEYRLDVQGQRRRIGSSERLGTQDLHRRHRLRAGEIDRNVILPAARLDRLGAQQR